MKVPSNEKELVLVILDQLDLLVQKYNLPCKFILETFSKEVLDTAKKKYPDLTYCLDVELPPGFIFIPRIYSGVKTAIQNKNSIALVLRPRQITIGNWMTYRRVMRFDVRKKKQQKKIAEKKKLLNDDEKRKGDRKITNLNLICYKLKYLLYY